MGRDTRASRLIILLLSIGFAALLAAAATAFYVQRQNEADAQMVAHTLAVEANLGAFASATERMETARRGLLLTQNLAFAKIMDESEARSRGQLEALERLISDNPEQRKRVRTLRGHLDAYAEHYRETLDLRGTERRTLIDDFSNDRGVLEVRASRAVVGSMLADELALLHEREDRQQRTQRLFTMDRLINAILNLSRQGRRTLAPETLDLGDVVRVIVGSLQHRIDETSTEVTVEELPVVVNDRVAVEQILSNLVENALKYLQPGRAGTIRVTGGTDLGRAWVSVMDNGRGIEPRDHERVFDLFRRSGVQDQHGEGIGLAHARALAYRLGGHIEVQSELGVGSTFRLILPLVWQNGEEND